MAEKEQNIQQDFNSANAGMNMDQVPSQLKKGTVTYSLNGVIENFDANSFNYQNEEGNEICFNFEQGYSLIGKHFIPEKNKHIFFLANSLTGDSEIGYIENNDCVYHTLVNTACLNFSIEYPIHKIVHKITNCSTEIYWTDGYNVRRWLDIDNLPYKLISGTSFCDPVYSDEIDCNQMSIQPNFTIPQLSIEEITNAGTITAGTYQFSVQYSDGSSNPYTSYYSITNPTPIADVDVTTVNFNYPVGKSIVVEISNLDTSGLYKYFNLAVVKTVNAISSVELVGTYYIENDTKKITYSGQSLSPLSIDDIFEKFPYYEIAQDVTAVQEVLVWDQLTSITKVNYQKIASKINLQWQTNRIPPTENYADGENATNLRGYLRDEVYPYESVFLLTGGKQTDGFHIPGRKKGVLEHTLPDVYETNDDFIGTPTNHDEGVGYSPYWKIYNTGHILGYCPEYEEGDDYKGPYQYGEFAYWESSETYPCNDDVWGELAGQPIRHHKFPDVSVSPIFETESYTIGDEFNPESKNKAVYPIGVKIDVNQVRALIATSDLTDAEKADIVGFKIVRGDRSNNKSIVAKGMLRNVGMYEREGQSYYYPNYPYNDLNDDVFLNQSNNAFSQLCHSYDVNITKLDNGEAIVEYTDCDSNKLTTKIYTSIESEELCSITKPKIKANAEGTVSSSEYEIWRVWIDCGIFNLICRGCEIAWIDPIEGDKTMWLDGSFANIHNPFPEDIKIKVVPNTGGPVRTRGANNFHRELIGYHSAESPCNQFATEGLAFDNETLKYRQVFNSPETSFGNPFLGNILKLENVIFGGGTAHFTEVKKNAKYKLLTQEAQIKALNSANQIGILTDIFDLAAFFTSYEAYLAIYLNGIPRKNFAYSFNSISDYNYCTSIPNDLGVKQRTLDIARYMIPGVVSLGDDKRINNYQRESSVYLKTDEDKDVLPYPSDSVNISSSVEDHSRFTLSGAPDGGNCDTPLKEEDIEVISYYASIKNQIDNQWGQMYSYETIDTGFQAIFDEYEPSVIFGGDTFICRFTYKTKVPFFIDNRVNAPDDSDIYYDEIGNIGYPKYWHSARSITKDYTVGDNPGYILSNIISYKAHNFDCDNSGTGDSDTVTSTTTFKTGTVSGESDVDMFYNGSFYLFAYGVPNFYCESSYNVDLRQAFNAKEGDFFPHVTDAIPDEWVQESNVSIANDNTYYYNTTFSKQNKENTFSHLPIDWESACYTNYPFRAIYSDPQNTDSDNIINAWLTYRAVSYFDFPQNFGNLTSLDGIQNKAILARFHNKSLLYNTLLTIDTSNPQAAYIGNPKLFSGAPPIDFAETDLGYVGSQHKFLLKIPEGQITIDAKRGQVFLVQGNQAKDLSGPGSGMNRFLTDNLNFNILKWFPSFPIDNHFKGIGLHGVYDSKYDRILITKLDYSLLSEDVTYSDGNFYLTKTVGDVEIEEEIFLSDTRYFCNRSWTLSYSFVTNSWIAFHSYLPNWYIGENGFFYTGINDCCDDFEFIVGISESESDCYLRGATAFADTLVTPDCDFQAVIDWDVPDCSDLEATAQMEDCRLEATAYSPDEPPCIRPDDLTIYYLVYGYVTISTEVETVSSGSYDEACDAISLMNSFEDEYVDIAFNAIAVEANSISVGENVYLYNGTTDCECIPDGWYFTEETALDNTYIHIVDCIIVDVIVCGATTTSTTTEPLECYFEAEIEIIVPPEECIYEGGTALIVANYDCDMEGTAETLVAEITTTTTSTAPITTTTSTSSSTTTTTTTVIPTYYMEMSVNDTTYDEANEENIPYAPVNIINTPTKSGYNYLFLSIPADKTFTIHDSIGTEVTSEFSIDLASGVNGLDSRPGRLDNYIYKGDDVFATTFSVEYTITIL